MAAQRPENSLPRFRLRKLFWYTTVACFISTLVGLLGPIGFLKLLLALLFFVVAVFVATFWLVLLAKGVAALLTKGVAASVTFWHNRNNR